MRNANKSRVLQKVIKSNFSKKSNQNQAKFGKTLSKWESFFQILCRILKIFDKFDSLYSRLTRGDRGKKAAIENEKRKKESLVFLLARSLARFGFSSSSSSRYPPDLETAVVARKKGSRSLLIDTNAAHSA